jgi:hypothetical protein
MLIKFYILEKTMSALITLEGIVNDVKAHDNENGSKRLHVTLSTRTTDWRRKDDKKARDYWNINFYVPQARLKILDYLVPGKIISVTGTPYKTAPDPKDKSEKKVEYVNIEGCLEFLELKGSINDRKPNEADSAEEKASDEQSVPGGRW